MEARKETKRKEGREQGSEVENLGKGRKEEKEREEGKLEEERMEGRNDGRKEKKKETWRKEGNMR